MKKSKILVAAALGLVSVFSASYAEPIRVCVENDLQTSGGRDSKIETCVDGHACKRFKGRGRHVAYTVTDPKHNHLKIKAHEVFGFAEAFDFFGGRLKALDGKTLVVYQDHRSTLYTKTKKGCGGGS
jgi:hypothetical protein